MEVLDFFEPVDLDLIKGETGFEENSWSQAMAVNTGTGLDISDRKIVLLGIECTENDDRGSCEIRKYLYRLGRPEYAEQIADLGNFKFSYQDKDYETLEIG